MAHQVAAAIRTQPGKRGAVFLLLVLSTAIAGTLPASAAAEEGAGGTDAPSAIRRGHPTMRTRDPAAVLARRLDLNPRQTAELRRLLVNNRTRMRAVWNDAAIAPDDRVGAVKAINEKTQAQIRELLTEEQKKKYFQPRPEGSPAHEPQTSVAEWLNVNRPRKPESTAATTGAPPDPTPQ